MKSATCATDFYARAHEEAALLRSGRLTEADIADIAEEIETLGRAERRVTGGNLCAFNCPVRNGGLRNSPRSRSLREPTASRGKWAFRPISDTKRPPRGGQCVPCETLLRDCGASLARAIAGETQAGETDAHHCPG